MPLLPLIGHQEARSRIQAAVAGGTMPQTLLLAGPDGVGKQRLALWIAQRLLCEGPAGEPCGKCGPCKRVLNLGHPDVHWFVPIPRPKAGEPDKQVEEAAETLAELMDERRQKPLWSNGDGMWAHGVATARLMVRRVMLTPAEAKKKVIIIGDAERLIAQAGSEESSNALLKVLEEPPADTQFVLTAADPRQLLPTIRSRSIVVRLGRLSDSEVREFLVDHAGLSPKVADDRVPAAEGSIGNDGADGCAACAGGAGGGHVGDFPGFAELGGGGGESLAAHSSVRGSLCKCRRQRGQPVMSLIGLCAAPYDAGRQTAPMNGNYPGHRLKIPHFVTHQLWFGCGR